MSRAAVFARIVAIPSRRLSCSARWASVLVSSARTRARSSRTSRATTWNFVRTEGSTRPRSAAASTSRTVRASTGMMPSLSRSRTRRWFRGAVRRAPDWRWPRRATDSSFCSARQRSPWRDDVPARSPAVGRWTSSGVAWVATPRRDPVPRICERSTRRGPTARPRWEPSTKSRTESPTAKPNSSLDPCALPRVRAQPILPARRPVRGQLPPVVCSRRSPATRR